MNKTVSLAAGGASGWTVVIPAKTSPSVQFGAEELVSYIRQMTGAQLPIRGDITPTRGNEIVVGFGARAAAAGMTEADAGLGTDGIWIRIVEGFVYLLGSDERGALNAVYTFLEEYCGCSWFTDRIVHVPSRDNLEIPIAEKKHVPPFMYRADAWYEALQREFATPNRCYSFFSDPNPECFRREPRYGGIADWAIGMVHTFNKLIPPEIGEQHPEYFSLVNGARRKQGEPGQLCLTNPDVLKLAVERVRQEFRANPSAKIASISQNDLYPGDWCECPDCAALAEREGSQSGPIIHFVNAVADAIKDEFPDRHIETLAYLYSVKPPKYVKPRDNVAISYCMPWSHGVAFTDEDADKDPGGLADSASPADPGGVQESDCAACNAENAEPVNVGICVSSREFSKALVHACRELKEWAKISKNIFVWAYLTNYTNYLYYTPNLNTFQQDLRFLSANNVKSVLALGSYNSPNTHNAWLHGYVVAKLLWDPDADVEYHVSKFLDGVYGVAGAAIKQYMDVLESARRAANFTYNGNLFPGDTDFFTRELVAKLDACMDEAERLAGTDAILERVRIYRMSLRYIKIMNNMAPSEENRNAHFDEFIADLRKYGIFVTEWIGQIPQTLGPLAYTDEILEGTRNHLRLGYTLNN